MSPVKVSVSVRVEVRFSVRVSVRVRVRVSVRVNMTRIILKLKRRCFLWDRVRVNRVRVRVRARVRARARVSLVAELCGLAAVEEDELQSRRVLLIRVRGSPD